MAFDTRGKLQGTPVQRCLRCGRGLLLLRPKGRVKTIPAEQWAEMERIWVADFPEDADGASESSPAETGPPGPVFDPTARVDDHTPGEVFGNVIDTMTSATERRTDLHPNGIRLAIACLTSAGEAARALAKVGDPELEGTEDLIARIPVSDGDAAMRVAFALAWFFAFSYQGKALKSVDRDRWLEAMQDALDPTGTLRPDDPRNLRLLFESYLSWGPDHADTFPLTMCRWVNLHLGATWEEAPDPASTVVVTGACRAHQDDFLRATGRPTASWSGPTARAVGITDEARSPAAVEARPRPSGASEVEEPDELRIFARIQINRSRQIRRIIGWGLLAVVTAVLTLAMWAAADAAARDPYSTEEERSYFVLWGPMIFGTWRSLRATFELRKLNRLMRTLAS